MTLRASSVTGVVCNDSRVQFTEARVYILTLPLLLKSNFRFCSFGISMYIGVRLKVVAPNHANRPDALQIQYSIQFRSSQHWSGGQGVRRFYFLQTASGLAAWQIKNRNQLYGQIMSEIKWNPINFYNQALDLIYDCVTYCYDYFFSLMQLKLSVFLSNWVPKSKICRPAWDLSAWRRVKSNRRGGVQPRLRSQIIPHKLLRKTL
jgi:hypothetical protein